MKTISLVAGLFCLILPVGTSAADLSEDWARGLDLERAAESSNLIVVVKVEAVEEIRFMSGGKGGGSVEQYKFKPLRVLKGVFARDELSLMSSDLGSYRYGGRMKEIQPGAVILLFLGRSEIGYANVNNDVNSWQQSMPLLRDENDPLTDTVKTLLAVAAERSESKRVKLLLERLDEAKSIDAIPLFPTLLRHAWMAAQNAGVAKALAKQITSTNTLVSSAAIDTAARVLEEDYLENAALDKELETALLAALDAQPRDVTVRAALFRALGGLGNRGLKDPVVAAHLDPDQPVDTFSEQGARLEAAGRIGIQAFADKILTSLQKLPLDAPADLQTACETALCRIVPDRAGGVIMDRIAKKCGAGLGASSDIASLAELPPKLAAPALVNVFDSLGAWKSGMAAREPRSFMQVAGEDERASFAETCAVVVGKTDEEPEAIVKKNAGSGKSLMETLVPPLSQLLDPEDRSRNSAILALIKTGSESAAKVLQPHLKEEQSLYLKLKIAEFLGKHGVTDGYPYAIEHMSDGGLMEQAVDALATIKDPKTVPQLKEILDTSNDLAWNRAAIRALGALGAKDEAAKFLEITGDWKNPLAAPALIALGDLGETKALPKVSEAFTSRNDTVVIAGVRAAAKLLAAHPDAKSGDVRDQLAALLAAGDADQGVRQAALDALVALNDPRLDKALAAAADDAGMEHSELLLKLLKQRKIVLAK